MKALIILLELICCVEKAVVMIICKIIHIGSHCIKKCFIAVISLESFLIIK